jgi:hypothetical protein
LNNPVEYGVYVFAETEGTTPVGLVEDTVFESNIQEDWALVMSEGVGAFAELSRNQFINNTGGIVRTMHIDNVGHVSNLWLSRTTFRHFPR